MERSGWWQAPLEKGPEEQTDLTEQDEGLEKKAEKRNKGSRLRGLLEIIKGEREPKEPDSSEQQKPKESLIERARRSGRNLLLLMRGTEKQVAEQRESSPDIAALTLANDELEAALQQGEPVDQQLVRRLEALRDVTLHSHDTIPPEAIATTTEAIDELLAPSAVRPSAQHTTSDTGGYDAPLLEYTGPDHGYEPTGAANAYPTPLTPTPKRPSRKPYRAAVASSAAIAGGVAAATAYAALKSPDDVSRAAATVRQEAAVQRQITKAQETYIARPAITPETYSTEQLKIEQDELRRLSRTIHREVSPLHAEDATHIMRQQLVRRLAKSEYVNAADATVIANRLLRRYSIAEIMAWSESKLRHVTHEAVREQVPKIATEIPLEKPLSNDAHKKSSNPKSGSVHAQAGTTQQSSPLTPVKVRTTAIAVVVAVTIALLTVGIFF